MKINSIHAFSLCFFVLLQADKLHSMQPHQLTREPAVIAYNFVQQPGPIHRSASNTTLNQSPRQLNSDIENILKDEQESARPNYDFSSYQVITTTKSIVKLAGAFLLFELGQNVFMPEMFVEKWLSYGIGTASGVSSLYDAYCAVASGGSNSD